MKDQNIDMQEIGYRIRLERERIKLTREQFAEAVDVSPTYVGQIERGQRTMSLKTFVRICKSLHVPAHFLIFGEAVREKVMEKEGVYSDGGKTGQGREEILTLLEKCSDRELRLAAEVLKLLTTYVP